MTSRFAAVTCALLLGLTSTHAQPQTGRQFQLVADGKGYKLEMKTVARPTPGPKQVLVRVRAVSLNQRDMAVTRGQYGGTGGGAMVGKVPLSDGAGEVVAVGSGTTRFRVGDRVAGIFFARWIDGHRTADTLASARGGAGMDGMLSEFVAGDENGFVKIPATRSPTLKRVAPGPTATTSPAPSESGTLPAMLPPPVPPYCALVTSRSRWFSDTARTRTRICFAAGAVRATVFISSR